MEIEKGSEVMKPAMSVATKYNYCHNISNN
jgi:hypothetical protein